MNEILVLAERLGTIGFPALLILIIYGSYKGIWVWGTQLRKAESDANEWKSMALRGVGLAETSVSMARAKEQS